MGGLLLAAAVRRRIYRLWILLARRSLVCRRWRGAGVVKTSGAGWAGVGPLPGADEAGASGVGTRVGVAVGVGIATEVGSGIGVGVFRRIG